MNAPRDAQAIISLTVRDYVAGSDCASELDYVALSEMLGNTIGSLAEPVPEEQRHDWLRKSAPLKDTTDFPAI